VVRGEVLVIRVPRQGAERSRAAVSELGTPVAKAGLGGCQLSTSPSQSRSRDTARGWTRLQDPRGRDLAGGSSKPPSPDSGGRVARERLQHQSGASAFACLLDLGTTTSVVGVARHRQNQFAGRERRLP
jgi:hypothetical protein